MNDLRNWLPAADRRQGDATEVLSRAESAAAAGWERWGRGGAAGLALLLAAAISGALFSACGEASERGAMADSQMATNGTVEVTARLVEVPDGAIFKRDLYTYATVLKYEVVKVHRGKVAGKTIFVAHYNPWKPRADAADRRVKRIGGNVQRLEAGQLHRLALDVPLEEFYMGGIVNQYFGQETAPLYWAVWTMAAR